MSKPKLSVVKIGGNCIEDPQTLTEFLRLFADLKGPKILVHGGGKSATSLAKSMGVTATLIEGRRITDAEMLRIITMVYAGDVNKNIVVQLQQLQCNALGLSGADGNCIMAVKRPVKTIDYGFVGDITFINASFFNTLLNAGITPVNCAISHDNNGQLLNTNADTIASEIAIGLSSMYDTTLYYCFEKKGVLTDIENEESVLPLITRKSYQKLKQTGQVSEGMLPKLDNCFYALEHDVCEVRIGSIAMLQKSTTVFTKLKLQ